MYYQAFISYIYAYVHMENTKKHMYTRKLYMNTNYLQKLIKRL